MSRGTRHYVNKLADYRSGETSVLDPTTQKLSAHLAIEIDTIFRKLLTILEANISENSSDVSVYTGTAGIAYLYLTLAEKENNPSLLAKGSQFGEKSLQRLRKRDVTFLCGDSGPLAISAVLRHLSGDLENAKKLITGVLKFLPKIVDTNGDLPDEMLYGRVGYLYSLLFIEKNIPGSIPNSYIKQIADAVIFCGERLSIRKKFPAPLLWEWYDELYVGGAHGIAGILYLLLQVREQLTTDQMIAIRATIDYLLAIKHPSGNFPSSIGSTDDRLVHWCHGAPGVVQLLLIAYKVWNDEKYLKSAEDCGEVVWQRGLLKKGYGICHGVAGNAYTFLALYQVTRAEKHLHRALQFAKWCETYDRYQDRPPDRPFSLFEGLAGTVYFLKDIQDPLNAVFPAYSLEPFK